VSEHSRKPLDADPINILSTSRLTRRRLLTAGSALGAAQLLMPNRRATAQSDQPRIRVLGWGAYFDPQIIGPFLERTGAAIDVTPLATFEDVSVFLRSGGVGYFDLITPTLGLVRPLAEAGLTVPLDEAKVPSLSGLMPPFDRLELSMLDGVRVAAPLLWSPLPLAYAPDAIESPPERWADLTTPRFEGQIVMADDVLAHFLIWNRALGAQDPTRVTRQQLQQTATLLADMKTINASAFENTVLAAMQGVAAGRGTLSTVGWQAAPLIPVGEDRPLAIQHPFPGDVSYCDSLAVVRNAPQWELAHALIDDMLSAETQARLAPRMRWGTVSAAAVDLLEPPIRDLFDYGDLDGVFSVSPLYGYPPLADEGEDVATYVEWLAAWDRIRSLPLAAR
jgi:spermidine/putrescine transport system substrate-binding protein